LKEISVISDAPGEKLFLLGNEAIARGAIEAGVQVVAAYPGTPSSEITETLAKYAKDLGIYVEWSTNEKVAFETALAAAICGVRALSTMKHVGVNVAHDPLMIANQIEMSGGLVLLTADDPWAWSSQNEQDNRFIAEQGYIPVLEPSSVQEAKDMMVDAFKLSEQYKQIFMFRSVTRVSHGRADVTLGGISKERRKGAFIKNRSRLIYTPIEARRNKPLMIERFNRIKTAADTLPYNQLKLSAKAKMGIIACGISYSYTVEAIKWLKLEDKVSVLKIGTPHPLPEGLVKRLLNSVLEVLVVEELEPFVETHIKAIAQESDISIKIHGKDLLPVVGELSTRKVTEALAKLTKTNLPVDFNALDKISEETAILLPSRPPVLCAGCPHRASHYAIKVAARRVSREIGKDIEPVFPGDIGCYGMGVNPPLEALDTSFCMGASFGVANGLARVIDVPIVAHMGDSTFFHSGIPPLINAVFNKANITMIVLDNSATAMTGFQPHPGTGRTATGDETIQLKIEDIARACGVKFVEVIDPLDLAKATVTIEAAIKFDGPSVVVSRMQCAMEAQREKRRRGEKVVPCIVDREKCNVKCATCIKLLGCPAITKEDGYAVIDSSQCTGCGLCVQVCPYKAIRKE
jgi:indolepyruvate ferredoxin oxidoreductase, alpha subunit